MQVIVAPIPFGPYSCVFMLFECLLADVKPHQTAAPTNIMPLLQAKPSILEHQLFIILS